MVGDMIFFILFILFILDIIRLNILLYDNMDGI